MFTEKNADVFNPYFTRCTSNKRSFRRLKLPKDAFHVHEVNCLHWGTCTNKQCLELLLVLLLTHTSLLHWFIPVQHTLRFLLHPLLQQHLDSALTEEDDTGPLLFPSFIYFYPSVLTWPGQLRPGLVLVSVTAESWYPKTKTKTKTCVYVELNILHAVARSGSKITEIITNRNKQLQFINHIQLTQLNHQTPLGRPHSRGTPVSGVKRPFPGEYTVEYTGLLP